MATPTPSPGRDASGTRRFMAAGCVLVAVVGVAGWQVLMADGGSGIGSTPTASAIPAAVGGEPSVQLCGVADLDRYVALPADAQTATVQPVVQITGPAPTALVAADGFVAGLSTTDDVTTLTRWTDSGDVDLTVTVEAASGGDNPSTVAMAPDGDLLAATGAAGVTTVARWHDDEKPVATYDLADLDRGRVSAVVGWTAGDDDAVASVVFTDSDRLALLRADGTVDPDGPTLDIGWYARFYPLSDGSLAVLSDRDAESSAITLARYSADGEQTLALTGTLQEDSANGRQSTLDHPTGVAVGPDGGLLLAGPTWRLVEIGDDGVWRRMALSGEGQGSTFTFADLTPFVRQGNSYYYLSPTDGGMQLSRVGTADLELLLEAPVTYDINHAATLDRLGYGAGLGTDATYDYFTADDTPSVHATFAQWWGDLADTYELRYQVTGDPSLDPPVEGTSGTVAIPADGGDVDLDLPPARPGPYDVSAQIVERATGTVRSATCLHYAVGAEGATFDPDGLADGADWGGAGPLRGVQLAHELGVGTHRVQVDFGRLVPDVTATPSVAALDLSALPGASDTDPFADIEAAAALAADTDVQLYVQVGQGGDAEHQAVATGTWGAWMTVIAEAFRTGAPEVHLWAPWNEPNNTGFGDGGDYARQVLAPFAAAVRAVDPQARVIGGNALNVVVPWYQQLVDAGGCASMDIVGIHPYTGYNRSWDEEGADGPIGQITALNAILDTCGADRPDVWDTESGWWSDGPGNQWSQGYDMARTSLWMRALGVDEWMYFFTEGGWGEGGFSWSLLQVGSFVKPGALAMATTATVLDGRGAPETVDTGIPATHAMRFAGRGDELLAAWTDDLDVDARLTATTDAEVVVTDVYGGTRTLDLAAGEPTTLGLGGAPLFLTAPAGSGLTLGPVETFGPSVLLGGTATASSTSDGTDPAAVLTPGGAGSAPWRAGATTADGPDTEPWLQVNLPVPTTVDRVLVSSAGIRCCTAGLRSYTVSVLDAAGTWHVVGERTDLFHVRTALVAFDPVVATAVRVQVPAMTIRDIAVPSANYSGQTAGLLPAWEPVQSEPTWPVGITALTAYGPGT